MLFGFPVTTMRYTGTTWVLFSSSDKNVTYGSMPKGWAPPWSERVDESCELALLAFSFATMYSMFYGGLCFSSMPMFRMLLTDNKGRISITIGSILVYTIAS